MLLLAYQANQVYKIIYILDMPPFPGYLKLVVYSLWPLNKITLNIISNASLGYITSGAKRVFQNE